MALFECCESRDRTWLKQHLDAGAAGWKIADGEN
jgi:hypothetical protein